MLRFEKHDDYVYVFEPPKIYVDYVEMLILIKVILLDIFWYI